MNRTEQIRISAYKGERLRDDVRWTAAERLLWYEYRDLYQQFRGGLVGENQAMTQKDLIMQRYETESTLQDMNLRVYEAQANLWKRIEAAANAYRNERTLEHADAFIEAVYGVGIKQNTGGA